MPLTAKKVYGALTQYVDESLNGMGALKGAPCTIKSIVHQDGINTVTFEWTANDGTKYESEMIVYDGTQVYVWESGNTYHYGDIVIYESAFYRCVYDNSDVVFDNSHWQEIMSTDGNYDIVPTRNELPVRFTSADKKMYYAYLENIFYLWDGTKWEMQKVANQYTTMPTASAQFADRVVQFVGTSTADYTFGCFYQCVSDNDVYAWERIDTQPVDDELSNTSENAVQNKAVKAALDSKQDKLTFDATPTEASTNPVTSGGVYGALQTKADASELETTKTATGSIVTVEDASPINAEDVTVELTPVQDLHGYDRPWAGGAGKNKFDKSTATTGKRIGATGQPENAGNYSYSDYIEISNGDYYFTNICGATAYYSFAIYDSEKNFLETVNISGGTATSGIYTFTTGKYIRVNMFTEYIDTVQIEQGSQATPYAPYSNICPISGWDEVEVDVASGNLFDKSTITQGKAIDENGNISDNENFGISDYIEVKGSLAVIKNITKQPGGYIWAFRLHGYDATKTWIQQIEVLTVEQTVEKVSVDIPSGVKYVRMSMRTNFGQDLNALVYEDATEYTIDLPTTIYGGTLDVTTGLLTVYPTSVDLGTLNWGKTSIEATILYTIITGKKTGISPMLCDRYTYERDMGFGLDFGSVSDSSNASYVDYTFIRSYDFAGKTAIECATLLSGVQLVYELATPQTYQLTPTQVKMLLNYNNIWANSGDTTLEYQPNNVIGDLKGNEQKLAEEIAKLTNVPSEDGTYILTATVSSGVVSYEWVEQVEQETEVVEEVGE